MMKGKLNRNRKKRRASQHHLKPKSRGGQNIESNLLIIEIKRHNAWHVLWENRTLDEVIALLQRLKRMKKSQRFRYKLQR